MPSPEACEAGIRGLCLPASPLLAHSIITTPQPSSCRAQARQGQVWS